MNKRNDESKTSAPPAEPTMEELESLTNPTPTADTEALKAALANKIEEFKAQPKPLETVTAGSGEGLMAFEMPAGQYAKNEQFKVGAAMPVNIATQPEESAEIAHLRAELKAELADLRSRIAPQEGILQATMRGTLYCPECKTMLDGGAATGVAHSPYVHPFTSGGASGPCKYMGWAFEKPTVSIRPLGLASKIKPRSIA